LFQSTPHFFSGANFTISSIHANAALFQSTPHFFSGANKKARGIEIPTNMFQSTPHFFSGANRLLALIVCGIWLVSIHAPLLQRGEPNSLRVSVLLSMFQSTPHFFSGANSETAPKPHLSVKFQSTPHFFSGANCRAANLLFCLYLSLHMRELLFLG